MKQLIFIYRAKSGVIGDVSGALRKAITGSSLCSLCNITHGVTTEKDVWKKFVSTLDHTPFYYHLDDIPREI